MISKFIVLEIVAALIISIKLLNCKRCDSKSEVFVDNWCYRLMRLNESFVNCVNVECILERLVGLYLIKPNIDNVYEFATLKPPRSASQLEAWQKLVAMGFRIDLSTETRILISQFRLNESTFVEGVRIDTEHPNLMIHDDNSLLYNENDFRGSKVKCILGHQIPNDNQSFMFKYGSCSKKLPFICTKPLNRGNRIIDEEVFDRCHIYRREYPGGNWIECEKLVVVNPRRSINASHKCCLFDLNMRDTFWGARSVCSRFDSFVYSFMSKGYKKILENYANFLSLNYAGANQTDFWTSCRLEDRDIRCDSDTRKRLDEWRSTASSSALGPGMFLTYVLNKNGKFRLSYLNMSLLAEFNQSQPDGNKLFSHLAGDFFLLTRRKPNEVSKMNVFTMINEKREEDCFRFETIESSLSYISVPYLKNCFHFSVSSSNQTPTLVSFSSQLFNSINTDILKGVLNSLGVINFNCDPNDCGLETSVLNSSIHIEIVRFFQSTGMNSSWLNSVNELLMVRKQKLTLHGLTKIHSRLELTCHDRFADVSSALDECFSFYVNKHCEFKCPLECDFTTKDTVWQVNRFEYLNSSCLCKAAQHSKIQRIGKILLDQNFNNSSAAILFNNKIVSDIWPPMGIKNFPKIDKETFKYFKFENSAVDPVTQNLEQFSQTDSFVIVKSLYDFGENNKIVFKLITNHPINNTNVNLSRQIDIESGQDDTLDFQLSKEINSRNYSIYDIELNCLNQCNNYYELKTEDFRIKFPINIQNDVFKLNRLSTILLDTSKLQLDQTLDAGLKNKNSSTACFWYINDMKTDFFCKISLKLSPESIDSSIEFIRGVRSTSYLIYPKSSAENATHRQLNRVVIARSNNCSNYGMIASNGECICWPGYAGIRCQQPCPHGLFGSSCQLSCSNSNCSGQLICSQDPIGCQCAAGIEANTACTQACARGTWGPDCLFNCSHCENHECDRVSGKCPEKCERLESCKNTNECKADQTIVECFDSIYSIENYSNITSTDNLICVRNIKKNVSLCGHELKLSLEENNCSLKSNSINSIDNSICDMLRSFKTACEIRGFFKPANRLDLRRNETCPKDIEIFSKLSQQDLEYVRNDSLNLGKLNNGKSYSREEFPSSFESIKEYSRFIKHEMLFLILSRNLKSNNIIFIDLYSINVTHLKINETVSRNIPKVSHLLMWLASFLVVLVLITVNKFFNEFRDVNEFFQDF